jgi:thiamine biosynthesis protein ThiS
VRSAETLRLSLPDRIIPPMNVTVNGDARDVPDGETVRSLVHRYNLSPDKVAIELNRRLVRSDRYDTPLKDGDEVEIVTFVGGG